MRQRRAPHSFVLFFYLFKAASHSALFCLAVHENYIIKKTFGILEDTYIVQSSLQKKQTHTQEQLLLEEQKQI